jgi:hypothetical protein
MAGFILMRVRQKRETRERRRLQLVDREQHVLGENGNPLVTKITVATVDLVICAVPLKFVSIIRGGHCFIRRNVAVTVLHKVKLT